jgi:DNA-binding MarR family transcriptional regulator
VVVEPTTRGREMLARVRRARFKELGEMLGRLEPDEREDLIRLFRKMAEDEPPRAR